MSLLHISILLPFIFALFVPTLYKILRRIHTGWFVLVIPIILFGCFIHLLTLMQTSGPIIYSFPWISQLHIHFTVYLDSLSLLFALIITGVGSLVVLYSIFYMSKREALHNFYVYLLIFMGAMLGVVLSDNLLVLYTFWEMTSFSSFLLIAYWYQRQNSRYGATKSLLITVFGGFSMLLGFLMLFAATGTLSVRELIHHPELSHHTLFVPAMLFILLGAFTKSVQFPFHIWLPDAMEAPTPISAYLHSATMVKAGVFLVARLTPVFGVDISWFWIVTICGIVTLFWGSFMAVKQVDLKALLAYSTVSQLGLIVSLLGIGSLALHTQELDQIEIFTAAIVAAIFHLINHSIFKGCLFMVIGILDHELGTRDIRKLGGLMSFMPISFTMMVIGACSMAGLPPFSGFLSKEMFFSGVLNAAQHMDGWVTLIPITAWIASIFTFVYCMILVIKTFMGKLQPELLDKKPVEAPLGMLISPAILASLVVFFFFFPNLLSPVILEPSIHAILPTVWASDMPFAVSIRPWHGWNMELLMTLGVILMGTLLFIRLSRWLRIYDYLPQKLTLNHVFNYSLEGLEYISYRITGTYMTGFTRDYFVFIFSFLIVFTGWSLWSQGALRFDFSANAAIHWFEYVIGLSLAAAAIYIIFSSSRLASIIALSVVGFLMALLFINFRAPDLALTQLVIETISTGLFLLCFYFLPKLKKEIPRIHFRITNVIISLGVGAIFTLIGLATQGNRLFEPIAHYFEQAEVLTGARNMVNAILVDFRGFDTMLEIVVLFMAGIGVYTLIKFRQSRRGDS